MSDQPPTPPPTWQEWKVRSGRWAWPLSWEWASEWIVHWSRSWDFVKVIELTGKLAVLYVAVSWLFEGSERERARQDAIKSKHYRAWELIYSAKGSTGDGGRRYALQDLNEDHVSLADAPLSKAYLREVRLPEASLPGADLTGADLTRADLTRANLSGSNLSGAKLSGAKLTGANLMEARLPKATLVTVFELGSPLINKLPPQFPADLTRANLISADLSETILIGANLIGADLIGAKLTGAHLINANLIGARLSGANLSGADLTGANLTGADLSSLGELEALIHQETSDSDDEISRRTDLSGANLTGANLTRADLGNAIFCNTTMPDGSINNTSCPPAASSPGAR